MPPDLKSWLTHQAAANRRSLNSELVKRLEESRKRDEKIPATPYKKAPNAILA
jgi:hypothetical protein